MTEQAGAEEGYNQANFGLRDIEEKQRILKDRLILIGQNLIEVKEQTEKEILELKKEFEIIKQTLGKVKSFIETISSEFSNFARKEDLEILIKQAKMFQPLELVTRSDLLRLGVHLGAEKLKNN